MDKTLEKGNLIDMFACLIPGMFMVFFVWFMIPATSNMIKADNTVVANLSALVFFIVISYAAGLILMEWSVFFQRCPVFDYFGNARKILYNGQGEKKYIFQFEEDCKELKEKTKIDNAENAFNHIEFWLITNGYNDYVERKKAYFLMARSLVQIPILFLIVYIFMLIYMAIFKGNGAQIITVQEGTSQVVLTLEWIWWKWIAAAALDILAYIRASRLARLTVWELSMTFLKAEGNGREHKECSRKGEHSARSKR